MKSPIEPVGGDTFKVAPEWSSTEVPFFLAARFFKCPFLAVKLLLKF